ncbi:hypothetical protein GPECTOR_2g1412 [Gonium pectorale]|uniref:TLC domain-containing protein n=1 Tax=Gonium pectorale TaxID=33097 RepID=A0A150H193_GONPE|nr:hypothetical protein GPECTOR_2g1412 [Gonium pectorale]|eukprot:KXZ55861.1 hypothetical protein GPECTOR_2g1412 [Gonium pectorale]
MSLAIRSFLATTAATDSSVIKLVAPANDAQYAAWFEARSQNLQAYNQLSRLLAPSLALCVLLCLARAAFVRWAQATGNGRPRVGEGKGGTEADGTPPDLRWAEGCWTMAGGSVLLLWSWVCVATSNGGCPSLPSLDTSPCLAGWPLLPLEPLVAAYYAAELAWYMHLLLKHHLGLGLHDSHLMTVHHVASIYLLVMSYCLTLHRPGVLLLALLNCSTPLLHLSKTAHHVGSRGLALVSFAAFAVVFFISRVVMFPVLFLPLGMVHSRRLIPHVLSHYPATFALVNGLLAALLGMQWVWFGAILRILRTAAGGDAAKLAASAKGLEQEAGRETRDGGAELSGALRLA